MWRIRSIEENAPAGIPPKDNPYRTLLRREHPEPLIAILAFILGIWLWNQYVPEPEGYPPWTEQMTLLRLDRDLRLAEAMRDDPGWLRRLCGVENPKDTRLLALESLMTLSRAGSLGTEGYQAFVILNALHGGQPIAQALAEMPVTAALPDRETAARELAAHRGTWWQARWLEQIGHNQAGGADWQKSMAQASFALRFRTIAARFSTWSLGMLGLVFLPAALRCLRAGLAARPQGYAGAWTATLGWFVFLVATLAWLGFANTLDLGLAALPEGSPPALDLFLDTTARLLPALIAIAYLFRRPSHAWRIMGWMGPLRFAPVLGMFSLLMALDLPLRLLFGEAALPGPAGSLHPTGVGWWGLAFTVVSACLMAPLAEETLHRGVLFRALWNRYGVIPAAAIAAVVFALLHLYGGYGLASVAIFGFTCSLIYAATGSLASAVLFHALYNAAIKVPVWLTYHMPTG